MLKKLTKTALLLVTGLILAPSSASAAISCAPEEFSLEVDMNEPEYAYLEGALQTPKQDYTFDFGAATDPNEKGISYMELRLHPPTEELLYEHVDTLRVEEEVFVPENARYLVILVKGDFDWGPKYFIAKIPEAGFAACMKMRME